MDLKPSRRMSVDELESLEAETRSSEPEPNVVAERFYLPVLRINDPSEWPSLPLDQRLPLTDQQAHDTCLGNCCGVPGLKAGCCHLDPADLEHVLGPIKKPLDEHWIRDILKWFNAKGIWLKREDVVVDFEEGQVMGRTLFGDHEVFKSRESYPMLRVQVVGPRYACKFLSPETGRCTIYGQRPKMCRDYYCEYIKGSFLVRTAEHPNRYEKLR